MVRVAPGTQGAKGGAAKEEILRILRPGGDAERREPPDRVGSGLDSFIGVWSDEDESELRRALEPFEQIDPGLWS